MGEPKRIRLWSGSTTAPSCIPHSMSCGADTSTPSRAPLGRHAVSIVNEQVRSATPAIVVGYDAEVKLNTVPEGEAVPAAVIRMNLEAQPLIEVPSP
jgi:hypothetical protein